MVVAQIDKTAFAAADSHFYNQLAILMLRTSAGDNSGQPNFAKRNLRKASVKKSDEKEDFSEWSA